MGRLIDADKLKQHYSWWGGLIGDDYVSELVEQKKVFDTIIDVQPTVDAERHGRWIWHDVNGVAFYVKECSVCGYDHALSNNYLYCPNCGAKMDESKEQSKGETKEVEFVEIVRCKDCKYYDAHWCTYWEDMGMEHTDFCSKAERKEDE